MSFISVTGTIKWDIFVFYIVSGVIFVTVICVIVSCLFLCCPANSATYQQHLAQAKYNRPVHVPLFKFYPYPRFILGLSKNFILVGKDKCIAHRIQQPILRLRIQDYHEFFNRLLLKKKTITSSQNEQPRLVKHTYSDRSNNS